MSLATARHKKTKPEKRDLLSKLQDIPTLPIVAVRVNELLNDPHSSSSEIADVLKKDQVLTAKVLRLVNSSYYAIPGGVTDVQRALAFLGFNTLAQLILGLSVMSMFSNLDGEEISMMEFWKHALATAVAAELLAKRISYPKPEEAFTCGLLHDIGKLVLHELDQELLAKIARTARERGCSFVEVEREMDVHGHAYLGDMVATRWGLPQIIRLAIRYHHFDVTKMDSILSSAKPLIHMVRIANLIAVKKQIGRSGDYSAGVILPDMCKPLGLSLADIIEIEEQMEGEMEKAGSFLNASR